MATTFPEIQLHAGATMTKQLEVRNTGQTQNKKKKKIETHWTKKGNQKSP